MRVFSYLLTISAVILTPIVLYNFLNDIDQFSFFLERLYDTRVYSYFPLMIMPNEELSLVYLVIAGVLLLGYVIEILVRKGEGMRDEIIFLIVFTIVALVYLPYVNQLSVWIDADQLNAFYSILIAIAAGIGFSAVMRWGNMVIKLNEKNIRIAGIILFVLVLSGLVYVQGGIRVSPQLPTTMPNGFYHSYYKIIDDQLPYSYATVGPAIERIASKNRHYFMDYQYFLDEYGAQDSLYHEQLSSPDTQREVTEVLPASIFVFVEKPPYTDIQQGILYDSPTVMRDIEQWIASFGKLKDRTLKVYYEDEGAIVYQIINRENESKIGDILLNIHPKEKPSDD